MTWTRCAECGHLTAAPIEVAGIHYCQEHAGSAPDMVNHPPHYTRGPRVGYEVPNPPFDGVSLPPMQVSRVVECIEVIRHIKDGRLYTAMKYIWRVAFGGKNNDREDIEKAIWYLRDWLDHPVDE
jgi:hypothetical protein